MNNMFKLLGMAGFFGGGAGGGSTGPADWNTLLNRPFYSSETESLLNIEWDGQIGDRAVVELEEDGETMWFVQLSDSVLTAEQLAQCSLASTVQGNAQTINGTDEGAVVDMEANGIKGAVTFGGFLYVVTDEGAVSMSSMGVTGMTKGVWSIWMEGVITDLHLWSDTVTVPVVAVVPLPEKYLPEIPRSKLAEDAQSPAYRAITTVEIVPETTLEKSSLNIQTIEMTVQSLMVGKTYDVTYDGVTYSGLESRIVTISGSLLFDGTHVCFGNGRLLGMKDGVYVDDNGNDEPFFIFSPVDGAGYLAVQTPEHVGFTISVRGPGYVYHKLPYEYMRESITLSFDFNDAGNSNENYDTVIMPELEAAQAALYYGVKVYGKYNGKKVEVAKVSVDTLDGWHYIELLGDNGWTKFEITLNNTNFPPKETNALSYGLETDHIILTSSTADSTKKFKVTVDDSGTLTATEIIS